jgi:nitrite reductase/ring-hydroxylating ferredoxin subunit
MAGSDEARSALLARILADAQVTRRDYLRILVTVSGGLLIGTGAIAAGLFRRRASGSAPPLRVADHLAPGQAVTFHYPGGNDPAMALRLPSGRLVGYSAVCTHLSCAVLWRPQHNRLECPCHNGAFDPATGGVLYGPPPRPLPTVRLQERPDGIWAIGTT